MCADETETMIRIAVAGFQHETNTFGATKAGFAEFEEADSWPGMLQGDTVISGTAGINLPMAGFVEAAMADPDVELLPIVWCSAEPSSYVTDGAFERISTLILDGLRQAGELDAVYLDLHGAMVTETHEDGEGELLSRVAVSGRSDVADRGQPRSPCQCEPAHGRSGQLTGDFPHLPAHRHGHHWGA